MQLTLDGGALVATRPGRTVRLQEISAQDRYRALRAFGVRESVAAAVVAGLITVTVKTA
jgi:hypothetical protein